MANVGASIELGGPASGGGVPSNVRTNGKASGASATAEGLKNSSGGFPSQEIGALDGVEDLHCIPGNLEVPVSFGRSGGRI